MREEVGVVSAWVQMGVEVLLYNCSTDLRLWSKLKIYGVLKQKIVFPSSVSKLYKNNSVKT